MPWWTTPIYWIIFLRWFLTLHSTCGKDIRQSKGETPLENPNISISFSLFMKYNTNFRKSIKWRIKRVRRVNSWRTNTSELLVENASSAITDHRHEFIVVVVVCRLSPRSHNSSLSFKRWLHVCPGDEENSFSGNGIIPVFSSSESNNLIVLELFKICLRSSDSTGDLRATFQTFIFQLKQHELTAVEVKTQMRGRKWR